MNTTTIFYLLLSITLINAIDINPLNITKKQHIQLQNVTSECELCESVVAIIDFEIKFSNSTIHFVEELLKVLCTLEPEPYKDECLEIVKDFDLVVQWILDGLSPNDVCTKLHLCQNTTKHDFYKIEHIGK